LTERKEELEMRLSKLEKQLSDRGQAYEELLYEYRKLQKATDEEIGHLRVQARSRDDEVQRVTNLYEDNMVLVKETKLESEALKSKIDVLKTEYYKLESTARQGTADIRAELAVAKERLANYELIEKELDQAIMHVANDSAVEEDGTNAIGNALIQTITSAPTTAKRRIQQSLLLANRLQSKQRDYESLQKELLAYKQKIEKLEDDSKL
jgi:progesterone-induced-blocking factor 1